MPNYKWFGYWLERQSSDNLAILIEEIENEHNAMTLPAMARIMGTTPAVLRSIVKRTPIKPVQGKIYYSPLHIANTMRNLLNDRADERAQTIPSGGSSVLGAHPRKGRPTYRDRLTSKDLVEIEHRAQDLGQWLSCDESAWLLGVTARTLDNWRRLRDRALWRKQDVSRWPAHFRSEMRTEMTRQEHYRYERLPDDEGGGHSHSPASDEDWRRLQPDECVPTSKRDPSINARLTALPGRYPPVVYDRNILVSWVRKAVYSNEHE